MEEGKGREGKGSNKLRIETGRREKEQVTQRICRVCMSGEIEDEKHFMIDCYAYEDLRSLMFERMFENEIERELSREKKWEKVMSSNASKETSEHVKEYVRKAIKRRNNV